MKINIENGAKNDPRGVFAMGLIGNLRALRDRTMAGDLTALDEFFDIHVFNDSKSPWNEDGVEYSRPTQRDTTWEPKRGTWGPHDSLVVVDGAHQGWTGEYIGPTANHPGFHDIVLLTDNFKAYPMAFKLGRFERRIR